MPIDIYRYSHFREIALALCTAHPKRGYRAQLARAAQCQPAYLSQALSGKVNLTQEQIFRLCGFWKFSAQETDYVLALHQAERTQSPDLRSHYRSRAEQLKQENGTLAQRVQAKSDTELSSLHALRYYSSWHYAAIHVLVSVPHFQSESALSLRLRIPLERVERVVDDLCACGLIHKTGKRLSIAHWNTHVDERNPLAQVHHQNWRVQCAERVQQANGDDLHYTAVHSLSKKDAAQLRQDLIDFIRSSREIVSGSSEEQAAALLIDFYSL